MKNLRIGIIGCGHMGEAILKGALANRRFSFIVSDIAAEKTKLVKRRYGAVKIAGDNIEAARYSDAILVAVKPQDIDGVLSEISSSVSKRKLIVSIAAGVTTARIERRLPSGTPVIRAMPNMPALIKRGVTAVCKGKRAGRPHEEIAKALFSAIGDVVEVEEGLMDAVTAVSGNGPAYLFYLVECMRDAAIELGMDRAVAEELATKTVLGSAELLNATGEDASELRKRVTSKGGMTEAAFKVFEAKGFKATFIEALKAARDRGKALSRGK
jgi:pyrroline-5-carboxylate reductase